ncbi:glycerate kinase [Vibrio sinensis]|uniref:Glycerate kinase n=1 Tax=Vibrio sinensis TaxID=2302434 RepID=A0A3A6QX57_9VIBR|nr:glycerate kinase [Vibrio sinensis]RJX75136.1 glycerate kinase [Vibrio sinensis]
MKIVIAPDSYKESLNANEVADAIQTGFMSVFPDAEYIKVPMSDGGEGLVKALVSVTNGKYRTVRVTSPVIGLEVDATYGILGDNETAIIEVAEASGLHLAVGEHRNPLLTTTFGTGELIKDALDQGLRKITLGLGGSATNDGGVGMAMALGIVFLDKDDESIGLGGSALSSLKTIDFSNIDPRINECQINIACDVENTLCGPSGASHMFGSQKGGSNEDLVFLDKCLDNLGSVIQETLNIELKHTKGAGAAGGLGAGAIAFLNAKLEKGIDVVIKAVNLVSICSDADLLITGEGKIDGQTVYGKTPIGVAKCGKTYDVPVIAIAGCLGKGFEDVYEHGIDAAFSTMISVVDLPTALANAKQDLTSTARNVATSVSMFMNKEH